MNHFVSRGGIKLQKAINDFRLTINDKTVLDVGSSTGGFVDCLLQNGAKKIYSVDTCYGELAWKLRNDPKVVVMERTNILYLDYLPVKDTSDGFAHSANGSLNDSQEARLSLRSHDSSEVDSGKVDLITIDCGWTKLELVLPVVKKFLKPNGKIITLLKPHYEADKKLLIKGVLPQDIAEQVKDKVLLEIRNLPASPAGGKLEIIGIIESPILGGAGNKEYLLYLGLS